MNDLQFNVTTDPKKPNPFREQNTYTYTWWFLPNNQNVYSVTV